MGNNNTSNNENNHTVLMSLFGINPSSDFAHARKLRFNSMDSGSRNSLLPDYNTHRHKHTLYYI